MGGQKTRLKYDAAYKQQVLQMLEDGQPASKLAQSLGIGESLIYRWKSQAKAQSLLESKAAEPADLLTRNIMAKWTMPLPNWALVVQQLACHPF